MAEDVEQLMKTVFYGNGKDGLVTRMTNIENAVGDIKKIGWGLISAFLLFAATAGADWFVHIQK